MFQRVLLAVDGTETGRVAASYVGAMARSMHAAVRVLYVNEVLTGRGVTRSTNREAGEVVVEAMRAVADAGCGADGLVQVAPRRAVAPTIVRVATEWGAEVIVLGSRQRGRAGRLLRGGVHAHVMSRTTLPTLTAPPPLDVRRLVVPSTEQPSLAGRGSGR